MTTNVRELLRDALLDPLVRDAAHKAFLQESFFKGSRTAAEYDVMPILRAIWETAALEAGPFVEDRDLDEMEELTQSATPGPWRAVQLDGFGADWFLVTDAPKQWIKIVAILKSGNIYHCRWMALVREFVPRAIAEIRRLRAELASRTP